ncbi:MAG: hypothetical protein IJ506_00770 [Clostridia bacterium]|nr:hypothetical protein [Clostridia bacterium]
MKKQTKEDIAEKNIRKTIQTRQKLEWHFVSLYLEMLYSICIFTKDKELQKRYLALRNYINEKISAPDGGDLIDTYVIVEQEIYIEKNNCE